jgi:hypothetical protein
MVAVNATHSLVSQHQYKLTKSAVSLSQGRTCAQPGDGLCLVYVTTVQVVEMQATSAKLVEDVLGMLTQMGDSSALNDPESEMSEMMAVLGALERRLAGGSMLCGYDCAAVLT